MEADRVSGLEGWGLGDRGTERGSPVGSRCEERLRKAPGSSRHAAGKARSSRTAQVPGDQEHFLRVSRGYRNSTTGEAVVTQVQGKASQAVTSAPKALSDSEATHCGGCLPSTALAGIWKSSDRVSIPQHRALRVS